MFGGEIKCDNAPASYSLYQTCDSLLLISRGVKEVAVTDNVA